MPQLPFLSDLILIVIKKLYIFIYIFSTQIDDKYTAYIFHAIE